MNFLLKGRKIGRQMCSVGVGSEAGKGEGDRNEGNMKVGVRMLTMGGC